MRSKGNVQNVEYLFFKYPDKICHKDESKHPKIQYFTLQILMTASAWNIVFLFCAIKHLRIFKLVNLFLFQNIDNT